MISSRAHGKRCGRRNGAFSSRRERVRERRSFLRRRQPIFSRPVFARSPRRILAISFKRDAARNLAERVAKRCPPEQARRFNSYTFDAFAKSLVDRFRAAVPEPYRPPADYRIVMPRRQDYDDFLDTHDFRGVNADQFERAIARARLPVADARHGASARRRRVLAGPIQRSRRCAALVSDAQPACRIAHPGKPVDPQGPASHISRRVSRRVSGHDFCAVPASAHSV